MINPTRALPIMLPGDSQQLHEQQLVHGEKARSSIVGSTRAHRILKR
jgi:hypothetical protein